MAVKGILTADEHAKLDDTQKAQYKPTDDGVFRFDLELPSGYELRDTRALQNALERQSGHAKTLEQRIKAVEDLEKDPAKAREALKKWQDIANWTPDQKVKEQIDAHVSQLKTKFDSEIETERTEKTKYQRGLDKALRTSAAERAIIKAGGKPTLLKHHVVEGLRVEEKNGEFITTVIRPDGTPRLSRRKGPDGEVDAPMGLDEFVETFKTDPEFAPAFAGSGPGGAGTPAPGAAGSTTSHRISRADAQDTVKYRAAKAAAAKAGVELQITD